MRRGRGTGFRIFSRGGRASGPAAAFDWRGYGRVRGVQITAARRLAGDAGPYKPAITYSCPIRTTIGRAGLTTEFGMGSGVAPHVNSPAVRVPAARGRGGRGTQSMAIGGMNG